MYSKLKSTIKNEGKSLGIVIFWLILALFLDAVHYRLITCEWILKLWRWLSDLTGITYQSALDVLSGNAGTVMTLVSMFLTIGISIAERQTEHLYGIPWSELEPFQENGYKYARKISHVAPLLIVIILNLSLCMTGYLLYVYCYAFYFMYYRTHEQSYDRERNQYLIVKKIYTEYEEGRGAGLLAVRALFERMGNEAEKANNWNEMRMIYNKMMRECYKYNAESVHDIAGSFFSIIFFKGSHEFETRKFVRDFMTDFDKHRHDEIMDKDWVEIFSIFEVIIMNMEEDKLIGMLESADDFSSRKKELNREWKEDYEGHRAECLQQLNSVTISLQRVLICVLLECRFQCISQGPRTVPLAEAVRKCWCAVTVPEYFNQLEEYAVFMNHYSGINFIEIIETLERDYCKKTRESIIANTAAVIL